jgi:hypothetical protein
MARNSSRTERVRYRRDHRLPVPLAVRTRCSRGLDPSAGRLGEWLAKYVPEPVMAGLVPPPDKGGTPGSARIGPAAEHSLKRSNFFG